MALERGTAMERLSVSVMAAVMMKRWESAMAMG
jgi:hypothetical protein